MQELNLIADEIYRRLQTLFEETLDLEFVDLQPKTDADDIDEWDSLSHICLIVAVEGEFGISINASEAAELRDVREFLEFLMKRLRGEALLQSQPFRGM